MTIHPTVPPVHLCIVQPPGDLHALGLVDPARYLRWRLRRLGARVTLAKNRLREDALNLVFGAHLGFDPALRQRHACLIVNLEQLGADGARLRPEYLALLRSSAVADYDAANVGHYASDAADVPLLPFGPAPYLAAEPSLALEQRPIDLLFFGSLNERRRRLIARVEAAGVQVAQFDHPLYGEERDHFIRQAKAVLNGPYYAAGRFEQVRVAHCLSLGTPVVSERGPNAAPPPAFENAVTWLGDDAALDRFFRERFARAAWFDAARAQLQAFADAEPGDDAFAELLAFGTGFFRGHRRGADPAPWTPALVNLGSGRDYKPGWLNLDILDRAEPDLVLDLAQPIELPIERATRFGGTVRLQAGSVQRLFASNVLEHVPDLTRLMGNALALLADGGTFEIEVPYEKAPTAWQDPTHVRALNENSWLYYTDWFWYLGWFEHRFEIARAGWLDARLRPCEQAAAAFMRVTLRKVATSPRERTLARAMRADFGGLPDDDCAGDARASTAMPAPGTPVAA